MFKFKLTLVNIIIIIMAVFNTAVKIFKFGYLVKELQTVTDQLPVTQLAVTGHLMPTVT